MKRVAINGFGRIGRAFFRIAFKNPAVEIVAINDPFFTAEMARYLLAHDSIYGRFAHQVRSKDNALDVDGVTVPLLSEREPNRLPWKEMNVDLVVESTGVFLSPEKAALHLQAGARRVLLSAPAKGDGIPQVVYGVNHETIDPSQAVVSAASCTTNSLVPVMYVLEKEIGVQHAFLTTVHGYTGDQRLVDAPHSKATRSRAAAINIVPTTTGAPPPRPRSSPPSSGRWTGSRSASRWPRGLSAT